MDNIKRLKRKKERGERDCSFEELLEYTHNAWMPLSMQGTYNQPLEEEQQIIALTAKLEQVADKCADLDKKLNTFASRNTGHNFIGGTSKARRRTQSGWTPPPQIGKLTMIFAGETRTWCLVHKKWGNHLEQDCRLKKKLSRYSKKASAYITMEAAVTQLAVIMYDSSNCYDNYLWGVGWKLVNFCRPYLKANKMILQFFLWMIVVCTVLLAFEFMLCWEVIANTTLFLVAIILTPLQVCTYISKSQGSQFNVSNWWWSITSWTQQAAYQVLMLVEDVLYATPRLCVNQVRWKKRHTSSNGNHCWRKQKKPPARGHALHWFFPTQLAHIGKVHIVPDMDSFCILIDCGASCCMTNNKHHFIGMSCKVLCYQYLGQ